MSVPAFQSGAFQNNAFQTLVVVSVFGQAQVLVANQVGFGYAQANVWVKTAHPVVAQANAYIKLVQSPSAQANTYIILHPQAYAQASLRVLRAGSNSSGQASVSVKQTYWVGAQANTYVCIRTFQSAQASVAIKQTYRGFGQAGFYLLNKIAFAQAQAWTVGRTRAPAQALALLAVSTDGPYRRQALAYGPIAHFDLGESSGNFINSIGTGNATVSGSITYGVQHMLRYDPDTAVKFNSQTSAGGVATISTMPTSAGSSITVSFWMMWSGLYGIRPVSIGSTAGLIFDQYSNRFGFTASGDDCYGIDAAANIPVNQWVHVSAVFYGGNTDQNKLYLNGIAQTLTGPSRPQDLSQTLYIGGGPVGGQQFAGSGLDELSVYSFELSSSQAWALYWSGFQPQGSGQAAARVLAFGYTQSANALAYIKGAPQQFAQAAAMMRSRFGRAQSQARIKAIGVEGFGQAQVWTANKFTIRPAQALAMIAPRDGLLAYTLEGILDTSEVITAVWAEGLPGMPNYYNDWANVYPLTVPYAYSGYHAHWGVRFQGFFTADSTGNWSFASDCDSNQSAIINIYDLQNNLIGSSSNSWGVDNGGGSRYVTNTISLTSGTQYRIEVKWYAYQAQSFNHWTIAFFYRRPGGASDLYLTDNNPPWIDAHPSIAFGQAAADFRQAKSSFAQALALLRTHTSLAQANAWIDTTTLKSAQAQVSIRKSAGYSQAQTQIIPPKQGYAQAQVFLRGRNWPVAQAQVSVDVKGLKLSQAQAKLNSTPNVFAQAAVTILPSVRVTTQKTEVLVNYTSVSTRVTTQKTEVLVSYDPSVRVTTAKLEVFWIPGPMKIRVGQANAQIYSPITYKFGQATVFLVGHSYPPAQAQAWIYITQNAFGQATFSITTREVQLLAQAQVWVAKRHFAPAQALAQVTGRVHLYFGGAIADIKVINNGEVAQAAAKVVYPRWPSAQALAAINQAQRTGFAQTRVKTNYTASGQAMAYIKIHYGFAYAQTTIAGRGQQFAQALAWINKTWRFAQALAWIKGSIRTGQANAQARIKLYDQSMPAQATADIIVFNIPRTALALSTVRVFNTVAIANVSWSIIYQPDCFAQAQTQIRRFKTSSAQAQVRIAGQQFAQSQARIRQVYANATGQALAMVIGDQRYLVYFNGYLLPGYAQSESYESTQRIIRMDASYMDGSESLYSGLDNKIISMRFKITGPTLAQMKSDLRTASTMLHSSPDNAYERLYIGSLDRHYLARLHNIKVENEARNKFIEYTVDWYARPWEYGDISYTISGSGSLDTGDRSLDSGTWTPARIVMTGTDITVSGYNQYGDFTGFISVSGHVSNLSVDSDGPTSSMGGKTADKYIENLDYRMYVGPGRNYYVTSGVTSISISWENRW